MATTAPATPGHDTGPAPEAVRDAVLEAARVEFLARGYHGASLTSIARGAGFTKGAVYSNFASKSDLFLSLEEHTSSSRIEAMAQLVEPPLDTEMLAAGLLLLVAEPGPNLCLAEFRAHAASDPALAARLAAQRDSRVRRVAELLAPRLASSGLELRVPIEAAVRLLLALVNGLALEEVGRDSPSVTVTDVRTLLDGLLAPASGAGR